MGIGPLAGFPPGQDVAVGDGTGRRFTTVHFGDREGTAYRFAVGDLDRDGRPDIAMARSGAPNAVYLGTLGPSKAPSARREAPAPGRPRP
jgi:hypothetical protein